MVEERRARQDGPLLQCPRCGSHNTKFCYYNNYNTAQPRHFCRGCQRYWTHGGALRNIPAGGAAGRKRSRRNENSTSPGPSAKLTRIHTDQAPVIEGPVLTASLNPLAQPLGLMPPPPPTPFFYGGDHGISGLGFSGPIPTLQLFNNHGMSVNGGFRGFHPFNPLMMPPLSLLHGINMQQHVVMNGGNLDGSSNGGNNVGINGANAGEAGNQDGHGDQGLYVNQFLTRFGNEGGAGEEARATFNDGNTLADQNQSCQATSCTVTTSSGVTPAKFM